MHRRSLFLALFAAAGLALPDEADAQTRAPARRETAEQRRRRLAAARRRRLAERQRRRTQG
jgi:hypothetical protein